MQIIVNGAAVETTEATLAGLLTALGHPPTGVATALNGGFVPATARAGMVLKDADRVEIVAPRQGG